ncbi:NrfD/PsrC family molybdoenzyme membrane anchor subunit [Escherichia coli]
MTLAVLLRRFYPQAGGADSTLLRTTLIVGPGAVILGLLILVFHLTRPWTFWKLMFHYSFYLGDVDGGDAVSALHGGAGAVAGENL